MAITCALIGECVAEYYGLTYGALVSPSRTRPLIIPRHVSYWLARKMLPEMSLARIAGEYGGRDHTTILDGAAGIDALIKREPLMRAEVKEIETIILASEGVLLALNAAPPQDRDPVAIADRLINAPLSRMQVSAMELRILAGAVLNQAMEADAMKTDWPDLRQPVKAALAAFEDWKSGRYSAREKASNRNLEQQLSALKARLENKETRT